MLLAQERVLDTERVLAVVQIGGDLLLVKNKATCRHLGVDWVLRGQV